MRYVGEKLHIIRDEIEHWGDVLGIPYQEYLSGVKCGSYAATRSIRKLTLSLDVNKANLPSTI